MNKLMCPKCGAANGKNARFCGECGETIAPASINKRSKIYLLLAAGAVLAAGGWFFLHGKAPNYYPLTEGMKWEYEVTGSSSTARIVIANLPSRVLNGVRVIPQKWEFYATADSLAPRTTSYDFDFEDKDGVRLYAYQAADASSPAINGSGAFVLKYPIRFGNTWQEDVATYSIDSINEVVSTPAGVFHNVVKINVVNPTDGNRVAWYAPEVGFIQQVFPATDTTQEVVGKLTRVTKP